MIIDWLSFYINSISIHHIEEYGLDSTESSTNIQITIINFNLSHFIYSIPFNETWYRIFTKWWISTFRARL
jgi:hypothetical protein